MELSKGINLVLIVVLFQYSYSVQIVLQKEFSDRILLYGLVSCIIQQLPLNKTLEQAENDCLSANAFPKLRSVIKEGRIGDELDFICRSNESITMYYKNQPEDGNYFLTSLKKPTQHILSTENVVQVKRLKSNTTYNMEGVMVDPSLNFYPFPSAKIYTLPSGFIPMEIKSTSVNGFQLNKFELINATINWETAPDRVCHYELFIHSPHSPHDHDHKYIWANKLLATSAVQFKYVNLSFDTQYNVEVYGKNELERKLEGPRIHFTFKTPSHQDMNKGKLFMFSTSPSIPKERKSKIAVYMSLIVFTSIILGLSFYYGIRRKRKSIISIEAPRFSELESQEIMTDLIQMQNYSSSLSLAFNNDKEISLEDLVLLDIVGEGAFGLVRKGILKRDNETKTMVAVKMLRSSPKLDDIREFRHEIEVMKSIGKHPNVINLIGQYTKEMSRTMAIIEYCSKGNLLTFLRKEWQRLLDRPKPQLSVEYLEISGVETANSVENKCYGSCIPTSDHPFITSQDLLLMAKQVAFGMEFLSKNKVVHRDLAARNILVCEDNSVKISDFGLSRDIYRESMYKKTGVGKLPIKWLALESLTHQIYTTQSDVWSFGVLLYEILTLGSNPYPTIQTNEVLNYLVLGKRMEKPINCGDDHYELMMRCWSKNPADRPNFTDIVEKLNDFLNLINSNNLQCVDPSCFSNLDRTSNPETANSYIQPIED